MTEIPDAGYVNYFEVLGISESAKPGEVRNAYKRKMKSLVHEIARVEINEKRRARYLLDMARLNAALCILRENEIREAYWDSRDELIRLENEWRTAVEQGNSETDALRREFEGKLRDFLSRYVEEQMLTAGRDKECVMASNWDEAHERHAYQILRHYRHRLYREILERLPYHAVTPPNVDCNERVNTIASILQEGT